MPPSRGRKASEEKNRKPTIKPRAGAHRPLHPHPTRMLDVMARHCEHCAADVSGVAQDTLQAYDRIEIPEIKPDVTRVALHGGICPCCAKTFKAPPLKDLSRVRRSGRTCAGLRHLPALHPRDLVRAIGAIDVRPDRPRHQRGSTGSP